MRSPDTGNTVSSKWHYDIIDADLQAEFNAEMNKRIRQKYLKMHPYAITHRNDGKWMTSLPPVNGRRIQKVRNTRKEVEDCIVEYWQEQETNPTVEEIFSEWNDYRADHNKISAGTKERNEQIFERFYGSSGFAKHRIAEITPRAWCDFLEEQVPKYHLDSKAFANLKSITRGFLKRAKKNQYIDFDVDEVLSDVEVSRADFDHKVKDNCAEVFDEDEAPVVMKYLEDHPEEPGNNCLLLMFVTGLRVGEVVALKREDIRDNTIEVHRTETRRRDENGRYVYEVRDFPKTEAGIRSVVVPPHYRKLLKKLQIATPADEYVFKGKRSHKRITAASVRRRCYTVCDACGVYRKSPHKIRKTYSSILLDNGADSKFVIDQMGHTDISCTETFYHKTRRGTERKQQILDAMPEFSANVSN